MRKSRIFWSKTDLVEKKIVRSCRILPSLLEKKNSAKRDIEMSARGKNFVEFTVGTFIVLIIVKIHISKIRALVAS